MKNILGLCLLAVCALVACAKGHTDVNARFKPMVKDRAIVVLRDATTGKILHVDTYSPTDLVGPLTYTNGPSVRLVCFGDLVNADVHQVQISGDRVTMHCQNGMIMGVVGDTLTLDSALSDNFIEQVQETLANEAPEATR